MPYSSLIIAGGRDFTDIQSMKESLTELVQKNLIDDSTILICGMARGADKTGLAIWREAGLRVHKYHADWYNYGASAGYIRNKQMGNVAEALVAFWDGKSRGTKHMIDYMNQLGKPVHIFKY